MPRQTPSFVPVERRWPGETFVCLASGPSLTREDCDLVREKARIIAVNNSYELAPFADVLYACDSKWWTRYKPEFAGLKFGLYIQALPKPPDVHVLEDTGVLGLERQPTGLRTGKNSGYQAIGLAVHLGASRIILLGYDMQWTGGQRHWHADHPWPGPSPERWLLHYQSLVQPLAERGIQILNCSRQTALTCFPRVTLETVFASEDRRIA